MATNNTHAIDAEQSVIGSVLFDNSNFPAVSHISPTQFFEPLHQRIWANISSGLNAGKPADLASVAGRFSNDPAMQELGGRAYLFQLVDHAMPATIAAQAEAVSDAWAQREIQELTGQIAKLSGCKSLEALSLFKRGIEAIETGIGASASEFEAAPNVADQVIGELADALKTGKKPGRMTGLTCVDRRLGGLQPGALIVLGGRPSMGKTALGRAIAHGAAVNNPDAEVLFFAIEMGPGEMMARTLSSLTVGDGLGVEYRDISRRQVPGFDLAKLHIARKKVPQNLIFKDSPGLTVEEIRRAVWSRKQRGPLSLVVIDYLQIMRRPEGRGRSETTVLGEITAGLKQLARQAGCTILLLSQLSRQVEARDDKRPMLSDLRESGSIEQDADAVLFVYREAYYLERATPKKGHEAAHEDRLMGCLNALEVICAKNRAGAIGTDTQHYRPEFDHVENRSAA